MAVVLLTLLLVETAAIVLHYGADKDGDSDGNVIVTWMLPALALAQM